MASEEARKVAARHRSRFLRVREQLRYAIMGRKIDAMRAQKRTLAKAGCLYDGRSWATWFWIRPSRAALQERRE